MENNNNMEEIVAILKDIQENERQEMIYAKKQSRFAMIISMVCLVIVVLIGAATISLVPKVTKLLADTNKVVSQANDMLEEAGTVIENLDVVTTDLAKVNLEDLFGNVDNLVLQSQTSIKEAMDRIDSIDFEGLNKAIEDLNSVVAPLARLFRR